jgi:glycine oxidase
MPGRSSMAPTVARTPKAHSGSPDVVIVGGGIIGLSIAFRARERGLSVLVLEREPGITGPPTRGASAVAAGMLAPVAEAAFGEKGLLAVSLESARRWPAFAAALGLELHAAGSLMVARDRDEAEALERELAFRRRLELPVERITPSEARRREPALAPTLRAALDVPDDSAVDPRAAMRALLAQGLDVRAGAEVERIRPEGGVVLRGGERIAAGRTVLAAGAWSGALAHAPVRPVKGQLLRLRDPAGPGLVTRVIRMADGYLVPRGDGAYVLGATVEEQGFDTTVTVRGVWELLRDATELVPGVEELVIEEMLAGLRPGTPDNAPFVGPGEDPGVVWATGHFRHGVLLAPHTADLVAAILAGDAPDIPAVLRPDRFRAPVPA